MPKEPGPIASAPATGAPSPTPSATPSAAASGPPAVTSGAIVITERHQRDAAVDKSVTVIGVLTRTKVPTIVGIDVDDAYDLSEKKVIAKGILRKRVETEPLEKDGVHRAGRGPGTYYYLANPSGQGLAKPTLYRD